MTLEELKEAIDNYIGLTSELVERNNSGVLTYKSSTGIQMFNITIGEYGEGWQFGGMSGALPESWKSLCHIHEVTK